MDPATLTVGAIVSLIIGKALETATEKLTEAGVAKLGQLRQKVQAQLQGNDKALAALNQAAQGTETEIPKVEAYLQVAMAEDPQFAQEVRQLAASVYQEINMDDVKARNVQQIFGGKGTQINDPNAPIFGDVSGGTIHINYGQPPSQPPKP